MHCEIVVKTLSFKSINQQLTTIIFPELILDSLKGEFILVISDHGLFSLVSL